MESFLISSEICKEVLKLTLILSLSPQGSDSDIVFGINQLFKASTALASIEKQHLLEWPTVKLVKERVRDVEGVNLVWIFRSAM